MRPLALAHFPTVLGSSGSISEGVVRTPFQWFMPQPGCILTGLQASPQPETRRAPQEMGVLSAPSSSPAWSHKSYPSCLPALLGLLSSGRSLLSVWRGHSGQWGSPRVFRSPRGHHCTARSVSGSLGFTPVAWFSSFFVCFFLDGRRVNPTIPSTACLPLLSHTLLTGFAPCPRSYNKEPPLARPHTPSS